MHGTFEKLSTQLAQVSVLIADRDARIAQLIREVLESIGFRRILLVGDGSAALEALRSQSIDFVITDWDMEPLDGLNFVKYLRTSPESPNKRIPIIMMTALAEREHVEEARDAGITEFVVKPFNVKTMFDRIVQLVENPRNFIVSRHFKGPDRRRRALPEKDSERRSPVPPTVKNFISRREEMALEDDGAATVLAPEYHIKQKIGDANIRDLLVPEVIRRSEQVIGSARKQFLDWVMKDFAVLEDAWKEALRDPSHAPLHWKKMKQVAFGIRSQAGTFGFELGSDVARSLYHYMETTEQHGEDALRVIEQHLDVLRGIFQLNIDGSGGTMGQEIIESLRELCRQYS